ncbi:MAG: secretion system protein [Geobacter sp.]|nr:MAG: secretion system protein [Geobacter sp.]
MLYFITAAVFISIALVTWAVLYPAISRRSLVVERLEKFGGEKQTQPLIEDRKKKWQVFLEQAGAAIPLSDKEQSKYTKFLVAAGYRKEGVYAFMGSKLLLAALLPFLFFAFYVVPTGKIDPMSLLLLVTLAIIGFLLPSYWLYRKLNRRKEQIFHSLPDVLDLITVSVEAGLSMDAALIRATETPQFANDPLAIEIRNAARETRAGKPRIESLKDMAERTMVDDVKAFVTMLAQTERFGTSLSQALRVHADSLRTKRRQIAEEAAAKTAIKLLFPLAFFVFPALLVVILGPAFIQITQVLTKQ